MAGTPTAALIDFLPAHGTKLYFLTSTYPNGEDPVPDRLWRTDGTAAGTKPLTAAGQPPAAPTTAVLMNNRLYFNGGGLWKTDGTVNGTKKISNGELSWLTSSGGRLYFTRDSHLWKSDGTATGTKDMGQFGAQWPALVIAVGGELCFSEIHWDTDTWALWESDGTAPGTRQVRSFIDAREELPQAAVGSKLFFAADDGVHGVELWRYTP